MRLRRLLVVLLSLLTLAACARQVPRYAAAPQGAIAGSELDVRMYGAPQPASYAVRRVASWLGINEAASTNGSRNLLKLARPGAEAFSSRLHWLRSCAISNAYFSVRYSSAPGATLSRTLSSGDFEG